MKQRSPSYLTETITVEKFIPGGQALATMADGKKLFLWNALPGEIVTKVELTKVKSHYGEGVAREFTKLSEQRIEPKDACYLSTSPWQILDYDYELSEKTELVEECFRQQKVELSPVPEIITDGQDFHYRNKMEYALYFDHADKKIHLAFHARGSHQKILVDTSSIEHPEIWQRATEIVAELNAGRADARQYQSLLLRCNQQGGVSGGLFEKHQPHPKFALLKDKILGQTYSYSPNGFFQINLPVYELALQAIQPWVKTRRVLDLYAGVGTIGLSVARGRDLTLVECDKSAYAEMVKNCQTVHANAEQTVPDNAGKLAPKPILAKSETALEYIAPDQTVILDPPRAGCQPELIEHLLEVCPPTIIYLSCNPATQARDVKLLLEKYQLKLVQPFNFFPRTPHLENLVVLEK